MKSFRSAGFTIIEVMLFLAISGALSIAIIAGSGAVISQQRYKDAANRVQALVQQQYNQSANVINMRPDSWYCDTSTGIVTADGPADKPWRGASECEILGRYIQIKNDGKEIHMGNVTGYRSATSPEPSGDIVAFSQYKMAIMPESGESVTVPWDASLMEPGGAPSTLTMFILRSPLSGSLRTFITNEPFGGDDDRAIPAAVVGSFNNKAVICVNPSGFSIGEKLGIVIQPSASSAGAIEELASGSGC